jgi:hypothetical protein
MYGCVSCHIDDKNFWLFWFFVFFLQKFVVYVCVCLFFLGLICIATIDDDDDDDDDDWRGTDSLRRKEGRIFLLHRLTLRHFVCLFVCLFVLCVFFSWALCEEGRNGFLSVLDSACL